MQANRERASLRAVQLGEQDQLALDAVRLETVGALDARLSALAKTRAAFSAVEDAVQAPLGNVLWIQPAAFAQANERRR